MSTQWAQGVGCCKRPITQVISSLGWEAIVSSHQRGREIEAQEVKPGHMASRSRRGYVVTHFSLLQRAHSFC